MASCTRLVTVKLVEQVGDVTLHGRLAHVQAGRDLRVGVAQPDLDQHPGSRQ